MLHYPLWAHNKPSEKDINAKYGKRHYCMRNDSEIIDKDAKRERAAEV